MIFFVGCTLWSIKVLPTGIMVDSTRPTIND